MQHLGRLSYALAVAALALTFAACEDSSTGLGGEGTLSIKLTDAPGDLSEAWVEITGIYLQGTTIGQGERVWLLEESTGLIDLLTLADRTVELVADGVVPAGNYPQLRFIVGDAWIVTDERKVYATLGAELPDELSADGILECPSCSETGFKVNLPGGAVTVEADAKILVVDFDVSQTFGRQAGLSGWWVMEPVLSASDFELSGTIAGTVSLADGVTLPFCGGRDVLLSDFLPLASASEITKSGNVNGDGSYAISFVEPGDYALGYADPINLEDNGTVHPLSFQASHPSTVTVGSSAIASADYTITGATCN